LDTERYKTGVTVLLPCLENPFFHKLPAGVCVLNGFGKTLGLLQIQELGVIEAPIALTSTLNVGLVHDALVGYMIERCALGGFELHSVNPIVCECCDSVLNCIQDRPVKAEHVKAAIAAASADFALGDVGAGRGTVCHGVKGGIGSASRVFELGGQTYTVGVLVQTNHGLLSDLILDEKNIGADLAGRLGDLKEDKGSCIAILATDLPLDSRQLARVAKRISVGLARLGSFIGQGSGEVFIAFSTQNSYDSRIGCPVRSGLLFSDDQLDLPFRAAAICAQEAVIRSMEEAHTTTGWKGDIVPSLHDLIK